MCFGDRPTSALRLTKVRPTSNDILFMQGVCKIIVLLLNKVDSCERYQSFTVSAMKLYLFSRPKMAWTYEHDILL